jgi:hypothetical protein
MAGLKRSQLPTRSAAWIHEQRAKLAALLKVDQQMSIPNIRCVLRCSGPNEVRQLIGHGRRLRRTEQQAEAAWKPLPTELEAKHA